VEEGARLRARLPAYLLRRQALLNAHCPLIAPLRTIINGYETPTTNDELWDTGLGAYEEGVMPPALLRALGANHAAARQPPQLHPQQ
jgi:hypothetical protein